MENIGIVVKAKKYSVQLSRFINKISEAEKL